MAAYDEQPNFPNESFDDNAGQQSPQQDNSSIIDPVKQLNYIDSEVDKAFEDIVNALELESNDILNAVTSIRLENLAKHAKTRQKREESFKEQVEKEIGGLDRSILDSLNDVVVPKERIKRYKLYNKIIDEVPIAARMLQVYLDNLLIKNPYTKQFLDVLPSETIEENKTISDNDKKVIVNFTKTILAYFKVQHRLKTDILPSQLRYGNFFVEIINFKDIEHLHKNPESIRVLTEAKGIKDSKMYVEFDVASILGYADSNEVVEESAVSAEIDMEAQIRMLLENEHLDDQSAILREELNSNITADDVVNTLRSLNLFELRNLQLNYVSPDNVIILRDHGIDYGYLIVEEMDKKSDNVDNFDVVKHFVDLAKNETSVSKSDKDMSMEYVDKIITAIFKEIQKNHKITNAAELFHLVQDSDTRYALRNILYEKYKKHANVRVRYVSPTYMVNFSTPVDKYAPYGTSIFDSIVMPARLYMLATLSSIISRLNRASVIRKWTIEVGAHRNHSEIVERFKKELRNNTISIDDISRLQDIGNILTDYKDVVTVQQNGKRFVDLDLMPVHDRSLPINELEQLKRELIEATGIPSSFLNVTDTIELREQLVQININFANTINTLQSYINDAIENLVNAIFAQLLKNNNVAQTINLSRYVDIKLNPPLLLTLQHLEGTVSTVTNLVNLLTTMQIPVDPVWMLKRFIKIVDWDAVETAGKEFHKRTIIEQSIQNQGQNTMQGGGTGAGF